MSGPGAAELFYDSHAPSAFDFIPQGGGDHVRGHRCPGEWIAIEVMKVAVALLCRRLDYTVPPQDFAIAFERLPALPRSRLVIADVRLHS